MEWEFGFTICKLLYIKWINNKLYVGFPGVAMVRNLPINAGDARDTVSTPGSGRSSGVESSVFLPGKFHGQRRLCLI